MVPGCEEAPTGVNAIHNEVYRYWLAMIRHEEALALRIRAAPPRRGQGVDLCDPKRGQTYFKLTRRAELGDEEETVQFLFRESTALELPLGGDRDGFFEHWLRETYRKERFVRRGQDSEQPPVVVGFPVIHDSRRGELGTLLRFPLDEIAWLDAVGERWEPPRPRQRRAGAGLDPPRSLAIRQEGPDDDELPYALDEALLSRTLAVPDEDIGRLTAQLRKEGERCPERMVRWLIGLLQTEPGKDCELTAEAPPAELLDELCRAATARAVRPGLRGWPIGLVYDGGTIHATFYLRLDLVELLSGRAEIPPTCLLKPYMDGRIADTSRKTHLGHRPGRSLTSSQREVAERFLGSRLTAAKGPPGTGKTELILALGAHALIERMSRVGTGPLPKLAAPAPLCVASTNNRAVDNVIGPLSNDPERLSLALRLGSRIVVDAVTVAALREAIDWLRRADGSRAQEVFDEARRLLLRATDAVRAEEAKLSDAENAAAALEGLQSRMRRLESELAELPADARQTSPEELEALREALAVASKQRSRLHALIELQHQRIQDVEDAGLSRSSRRTFVRLTTPPKGRANLWSSLKKLDIAFQPEPPPPKSAPPGELTEWLERTLDLLEDLETDLKGQEARLETLDRGALQRELEEARNALASARASAEVLDTQRQVLQDVRARWEPGLFETAQTLREAWAVLWRERLTKSLELCAEALAETRSPKRVASKNPDEWRDLLRLFPVMGCTLLSMGNCFAMESGQISRLIVDEAGQCHPAYVVPGLYRATRALIIGDVHQLEPVIELDAHEETRVLRRTRCPLDMDELEPFRVVRNAGTSAQSLAERACGDVPVLRDHFRCQEPIIRVSNALCGYDLRVHTIPRSLGDQCAALAGPLVGIDVRGAQAPFLGSWRNDSEVERVIQLLRLLVSSRIAPDRIAVLTPYRGQLLVLRRALEAAGIPLDDPDQAETDSAQQSLFGEPAPGGVATGTVHRFQGGERDIVIFSAVATRERSLPFTNSRVNLVNVAVSRARLHFVVVGDRALLSRGRVTGALVGAIEPDRWLSPALLTGRSAGAF